jgi:ABC-2 type transport system ATP-binding protein
VARRDQTLRAARRARGLELACRSVRLRACSDRTAPARPPRCASRSAFARASAGRGRAQGHPPSASAARAGLGLLPERLALPGRATPQQWLALHAQLIGLARGDAESAIARALERTGIADRAHEPIASLSTGLRQRLGFANALLGAPTLLVLDEPGTGLDPLGIRDARGWIEAERARGATVLICSHQLSEVERTCDHVAILDRGRVVASGATRVVVGPGETLEDVFVRAVGR